MIEDGVTSPKEVGIPIEVVETTRRKVLQKEEIMLQRGIAMVQGAVRNKKSLIGFI